MNFSEVELIISDLDGTLLNNNHQISSRFFEQFQQLKSLGVKFIAASGRQYHGMAEKFATIKNEITIIAENGAYIVHKGEELDVNAIPSEQVNLLIKIALDLPKTHIVLCGKKRAYFGRSEEGFENIIKEFYPKHQIIENYLDLADDDFLKIAIHHPEGSEAHILPYFSSLSEDFQLKISDINWLDISLKSTHKGNAIEKIQQQLNIDALNTMAFGDYNNDAEMLTNANFSFAMENAHPNIKAIAKYETTSNENFGVENIIEKVITAKKAI